MDRRLDKEVDPRKYCVSHHPGRIHRAAVAAVAAANGVGARSFLILALDKKIHFCCHREVTHSLRGCEFHCHWS